MTKLRQQANAAATLAWTTSKATSALGVTAAAALRVQAGLQVYQENVLAATAKAQTDAASAASLGAGLSPSALDALIKHNVTQVGTSNTWPNGFIATLAAGVAVKHGVDALLRLRAMRRASDPSGKASSPGQPSALRDPKWPVAMVLEGALTAFYVSEIALNNSHPTNAFLVTNAAVVGAAIFCCLVGSMGWDRQRNRAPADRPHLGGVETFRAATFLSTTLSSAYLAAAYTALLPHAMSDQLDAAAEVQTTHAASFAAGGFTTLGSVLGLAALVGVAASMLSAKKEDGTPLDLEKGHPLDSPSYASSYTLYERSPSASGSLSQTSKKARRHSF